MNLSQEDINMLGTMINDSLERIYAKDYTLIENAVNERAIVFKFGLYFHELLKGSSFEEFDLDCEYNRNMGEPKRTVSFPTGVIPDVLLHRRNCNEHNVLVVEFKGYWNRDEREKDIQKLMDFTDQEDTYKYGLGVLIELNRDHYTIRHFQYGKEI